MSIAGKGKSAAIVGKQIAATKKVEEIKVKLSDLAFNNINNLVAICGNIDGNVKATEERLSQLKESLENSKANAANIISLVIENAGYDPKKYSFNFNAATKELVLVPRGK